MYLLRPTKGWRKCEKYICMYVSQSEKQKKKLQQLNLVHINSYV